MSTDIDFKSWLEAEEKGRNNNLGDNLKRFNSSRNLTRLSPNKLRPFKEFSRLLDYCHDDDLSSYSSLAGGDTKNDIAAQDCYEEIDERMSRNSFEYPEQQARYVDRWLDDIKVSRNGSDWSQQDCGNVIGIRGFSGIESRNGARRYKESLAHVRLKSDHSKLQKDFEILKNQYNEVMNKLATYPSGSKCSHKDLMSNCSRCLHQHERFDKKDREHHDMVSALREENEKLRSQATSANNELLKEVDNLRKQLTSKSLGQKDKLLMTLRNENSRLKDITEVDILEFEAMRENYLQLESQVRSLIQDQEKIDRQKSEENASLMTELCRLQVYQPKLEMILETERSIKAELQNKIGNLQVECNQMKEQLNEQSLRLNNERMRTKKCETVEIERLHSELTKWQDNYHRLAREKSDIENLLRSSRSKVAQLDAEYQMKLDQSREAEDRQVKNLKLDHLRLEEENKRYELQVEALEKKLYEHQKENDKMRVEINDLKVQIKNQEVGDAITKQLEMSEKSINDLKLQIRLLETRNGELTDTCESLKTQLEQGKLQIDQLNHRCHLQQCAYDELREKKDKELARLKTNLNFEQYNRQVALKGIEKELRASLKELDAVKCRFANRFVTAEGSKEINKTAKNRVRFCHKQNDNEYSSDTYQTRK